MQQNDHMLLAMARYMPVRNATDSHNTTGHPGTPVAKEPVCRPPHAKATNCDKRTRTVNTGAECGAVDDFYYYSPRRAPGSKPVFHGISPMIHVRSLALR